jgi:transmembrane sensor
MQTEKSFRELLDRYLAGSSTPKENAVVEEWFEKGGNTSKPDFQLTAEDRARLLNNIHRLQGSPVAQIKPKSRYKIVSGWRAAAIWIGLLITVGAGIVKQQSIKQIFIQHTTAVIFNNITTGKGEIKQVILPDSSVVMLNANSSITYQSDFAKHRQLKLSGEALFTVTHDKEHPFTVHTPDSVATTVLGTQFNINCYAGGEDVHIAVISGRVRVSKAGKTLDTLTKAQAIRYNKASQDFTLYYDVTEERITSWATGQWEYDNLRFSDLAVLLQNQYGVTLTTRANELSKLQTHVSINFNKQQSATELLEVFCSIAGCHFQILSPNETEIY